MCVRWQYFLGLFVFIAFHQSFVLAEDGEDESIAMLLDGMGASSVGEVLSRHKETAATLTETEGKYARLQKEAQEKLDEQTLKTAGMKRELDFLKKASSSEIRKLKETIADMEKKAPVGAGSNSKVKCSVEFMEAYRACSEELYERSQEQTGAAGSWLLHMAISGCEATNKGYGHARKFILRRAIPATHAALVSGWKMAVTTGVGLFDQFLAPHVLPPYNEHLKSHVDSVLEKSTAVYNNHLFPLIYPAGLFVYDKLNIGAYYFYTRLLSPDDGLVGAPVAEIVYKATTAVSRWPLVARSFSSQEELVVFVIFCVVMSLVLVLVSIVMIVVLFKRGKNRGGERSGRTEQTPLLTRNYSMGA